jgi:organic hydroperoxide reductase OsmC/OhrA
VKHTAKAQWSGTLKEGKGELPTQSEVVNKVNYSFKIRIGEEKGTNPEEFETITKNAEQNCLISKVLNIPISSEAHFVS